MFGAFLSSCGNHVGLGMLVMVFRLVSMMAIVDGSMPEECLEDSGWLLLCSALNLVMASLSSFLADSSKFSS